MLSYEIQRALTDARPATIGEALLIAKRDGMDHDDAFHASAAHANSGRAAQDVDASRNSG